MPRKIRIIYAGGMYHVLNRGNYKARIFEKEGAKFAFEAVLLEAAEKFGLVIYAYAIMRTHFHLAIKTPRPNLAEAVHWIESTFATRLNRFRGERGHVFQGRYKALLVEPGHSLARLVNYIHLNPVKPKITTVENLRSYRWTSIFVFLSGNRPAALNCCDWLDELDLEDTPVGWESYRELLVRIAGSPELQKEAGFDKMDRGWAIGSKEWKKQVVEEFRSEPILDAPYGEKRDSLRKTEWNAALDDALSRAGRTRADLRTSPKGEGWKLEIAMDLKTKTTATSRWLADALHLGAPSSLRTYLSEVRSGRRSLPGKRGQPAIDQ